MRTTFENLAIGEHFEYAGDAWIKLTSAHAEHIDTGDVETFAFLGAMVLPIEHGMICQ